MLEIQGRQGKHYPRQGKQGGDKDGEPLKPGERGERGNRRMVTTSPETVRALALRVELQSAVIVPVTVELSGSVTALQHPPRVPG